MGWDPHPILKCKSYAHVDVAMRGCTVSIDGTQVTIDGFLVA
jgi:2,5-dihydroxypyridine 5,6-dioxygenase